MQQNNKPRPCCHSHPPKEARLQNLQYPPKRSKTQQTKTNKDLRLLTFCTKTTRTPPTSQNWWLLSTRLLGAFCQIPDEHVQCTTLDLQNPGQLRQSSSDLSLISYSHHSALTVLIISGSMCSLWPLDFTPIRISLSWTLKVRKSFCAICSFEAWFQTSVQPAMSQWRLFSTLPMTCPPPDACQDSAFSFVVAVFVRNFTALSPWWKESGQGQQEILAKAV